MSEKFIMRTPAAYLFLGSLFEREIIQKFSYKINQKLHLGRTPKGILILGVAFEREIVRTPKGILLWGVPLRAEINQKFILKIIQKYILSVHFDDGPCLLVVFVPFRIELL